MKIANLKTELEPKTTLFKEEVDVIIAVVTKVLEHDERIPKSGTFLLYGVKNDEHEPQKLISFDIGKGPTKHFLGRNESSRKMAEAVLSQDARNEHIEGVRSAMSYFYDSPLFLYLVTTHGHFSCAYYAESGDYSDMEYVYCAVARALANMGKEDEALQDECEHLFFSEVDEYPGLYALREFVDELFEKCELPELKKWHEWHEPANSAGELTLFFQ